MLVRVARRWQRRFLFRARPDGIESATDMASMARAVLGVLALLALGTVAPASAKVLCPPGEFVLESDTADVRGQALAESKLMLGKGRAELTSLCELSPARGYYKPMGFWGHRVSSRLARCKGGRPIKLRATWDLLDAPWCTTLDGVLRVGRGRRVAFRAVRVPECGNGLHEAGEQCDDGNAAAGDCCTADCRAEPGCEVICDRFFPCAADERCVPKCGGLSTCRPLATLECGDGPVCGCDRNTQFRDRCAAWDEGQGVGIDGPCPIYCSTDANCAAGEFCGRGDATCAAWLAGLAVGICAEEPSECWFLDNPVCGCDGTTYRNRCVLAQARMSPAHAGPCP
jgi:cysteine-rich repeat protein